MQILNSFIFPGCQIGDNCVLSHTVIGPNCVLEGEKLVLAKSVLGQGVHIETGGLIDDVLVQSTKPELCKSVVFLIYVLNC